MGTNFYVDGRHIGKRSAAGWYCWDCDITLCKNGNEGVNLGASKWYEVCPTCNKTPPTESLSSGAVARELGFDKGPFQRKAGVASCSAFRWALDPDGEDWKKVLKKWGKPVVDEYGTKFSVREFQQMLIECPIQHKDPEWYGTEFR